VTHEESAANLAGLQAIIDRSTKTATPSVADSVAYPARQMTAAEFVEFWSNVRLVAMTTVGEKGQPHLAPVHAQIAGTSLKLVVYENTIRRGDLARNPRVGFTTWDDQGAAVIVYGRAREVPGSIRDARSGQSGQPRRVIGIEVAITRIYAMRAPQRSPGVS
jgi:hypothetical protein